MRSMSNGICIEGRHHDFLLVPTVRPLCINHHALSYSAKMTILESSAGLLNNFEVLDFLRNKSRSTTEDDNLSESKNVNLEVGEANQYDKLKRNLTSSEMKVYDYLIDTAARGQTRDCVAEFLQKCKKISFCTGGSTAHTQHQTI